MVRDTAGVSDDRRAVSEVVGYVIIAGLILTSISIVYVNGYPALQDVRDNERQRSVQSAFSVLDENMDDITTGGSVKRQTEMNLIGDSLGVDPDRRGWVDVSIRNSTNELCDRGCNVSFTPVVYENGAQGLTNPRAPGPSGAQVTIDQIVYENGAVIRDPGENGSGMTDQPNWVVKDDGVVLNLVSTRGSNTVTGEGTFSIIAEERSTDNLVETNPDGGLNVTVRIRTFSPTAWKLYMESFDAADNVTCPNSSPDPNTCLRDGSPDIVRMNVTDVSKAIRSKTVVDAEAR